MALFLKKKVCLNQGVGMQDISTVEVRQHPWEAEIKSRALWEFDAGPKEAEAVREGEDVAADVYFYYYCF